MNQHNEQPGNNYDYDEIDLRDIFKTLGKWKYTIIGITVACMLISGIVSSFFIDPLYEANTRIMVNIASPPVYSSNASYIVTEDNFDTIKRSMKISDITDNSFKLEQSDINSYIVLMTSDQILQSVIEKLDLKITPAQLRGQISIQPANNTQNVCEIKVSNLDPNLAANIANTLVNQIDKHINQSNQIKINELLSNLETKLNTTKNELNIATIELKKYQVTDDKSLQNEIELHKQQNQVQYRQEMVEFLNSKILELEIVKSLDSIKDKTEVISAATIPENPVKPNTKLNNAIAGVLGLMISVFGVFLVEYLKQEDI